MQVNQWCESGIYLLALQAVDKCQTQEGAESALSDIESFRMSADKNKLTELKNLHNQDEVVLSPDLRTAVVKALKRLEDMQEMFDKRQVSLKRLSAKQTRPVQPVAPRPESSPKRPSVKNSGRTNGGQKQLQQQCESVTLLSNAKKTLHQTKFLPFCPSALAQKASEYAGNRGVKQSVEDQNKRKNTRKARGGIKVKLELLGNLKEPFLKEAKGGGSLRANWFRAASSTGLVFQLNKKRYR